MAEGTKTLTGRPTVATPLDDVPKLSVWDRVKEPLLVVLTFAVLMVALIPLILAVPDHHGQW